MQAMFDGYLKNSTKEIQLMIQKIISDGDKSGIKTSYLKENQFK